MKYSFFLLANLFIITFYFTPLRAGEKEMYKGVKVYFNSSETREKYEADFTRFISDLKENKINTLFTPVYEGERGFYKSKVIKNPDESYDLVILRNKLKKEGIYFGAICHIFFDPDRAAYDKNILPIDQNGSSEYVNWQKLVCPTDANYRKYKLKILEEVAQKFHPDFISLDFIRYPVVWELINFGKQDADKKSSLNDLKKVAGALNNAKSKGIDAIKEEIEKLESEEKKSGAEINPDTLRQFCFCERCIKQFSEKYKIVIPSDFRTTKHVSSFILKEKKNEWYRWKADVINSFVQEAVSRIKKIDKKIKISLHLVPWDENLLDNGLYKIASQDINSLSQYVDCFTPMIYNRMIGLPDDYIKTLSKHLSEKTGKLIIPSIQSDRIIKEAEINADDFFGMLDNSLLAPSGGVLIFRWESLFGKENENLLRAKKRGIVKEKFGR